MGGTPRENDDLPRKGFVSSTFLTYSTETKKRCLESRKSRCCRWSQEDVYREDRMASNNLPVGAKALLDAGADPAGGGDPMHIAQQSEATAVIEVLKARNRHFSLVPGLLSKSPQAPRHCCINILYLMI